MLKDVIINRSAIREARYNKKFTMNQAADEANISQGLIHRVEKGTKVGMSATVLYKLAKAYGVTMESLMKEVEI